MTKEIENHSLDQNSIVVSQKKDLPVYTPISKKKCIRAQNTSKGELSNIDIYKRQFQRSEEELHKAMTSFLNTLYDEIEKSRAQLEASCVKSLECYSEAIEKLERLRDQNEEHIQRLQKTQTIVKSFSQKITNM
ncbi:hypothetical protein cand_037600 [Cryptosporidium andersoni]|uniref:Uncharacterized protein n=1 Tax=Cryptosporidium andersoni TaxID=117008 RepID=A0A1J4MUT3_9CRYT|nr:hypothetical protein cand_037600 [Cryptosporidium andersoni]